MPAPRTHSLLCEPSVRPKRECDSPDQQCTRDEVVPAERLTKNHHYKYHKHNESYAFLHDFELRHGEVIRADPVGWTPEHILEKSIAQLTTVAASSGVFLYFRWPYHATVIN